MLSCQGSQIPRRSVTHIMDLSAYNLVHVFNVKIVTIMKYLLRCLQENDIEDAE
jgi:hypothetical protein